MPQRARSCDVVGNVDVTRWHGIHAGVRSQSRVRRNYRQVAYSRLELDLTKRETLLKTRQISAIERASCPTGKPGKLRRTYFARPVIPKVFAITLGDVGKVKEDKGER